MTKQLPNCVKRQLFDIEVEPDNDKLSGIIPLSHLKNDDYMNSDENSISDNNNLELGENDYDSDCSLGSMNSLYLREFSTGTKIVNKNQPNYNDNLNKDDQSPKKMGHTITQISAEKKNETPIKKLDVVSFYGQKKFTQQHIFSSKQLQLRQSKIKYMFSKLRKPTYSVCKFKRKINKLGIPLKNKYLQRQLSIMKTTKQILHKDKKLIRNHLKIRIPLLPFNHKTVNTAKQNNLNLSKTVLMMLNNEMESITNSVTVLKKNDPSLEFSDIENDLSEINTFNINDFMDEDDFEDLEIVNVVKNLFEESDLFTENEINDQWSLNEHVSCKETEQTCSELSKPYDEPQFRVV